ncbi:Pentatricopeptide repeat-containing protein [Zea mays]|uniref:Pentatricopeptide repeat-containing protein n=1 Tax=Zea mays TaxID=4577 RepID=A0A1D6JHJ9_MAIZE|nr:Pentatricopeptide repeat-containing protein [Zea mays]
MRLFLIMPCVAPKPSPSSPDIQTWFSAVSWRRLSTVSRVAVLSGPTSYDRTTRVCWYRTPPSTISACRNGSTVCFSVGMFCRLRSSPASSVGSSGSSGGLSSASDLLMDVSSAAPTCSGARCAAPFTLTALPPPPPPEGDAEHLTTKTREQETVHAMRLRRMYQQLAAHTPRRLAHRRA